MPAEWISHISSGCRVARICRYPVKGLGGEDLPGFDMGPSGIPFDRILGFANGRVPVEPFGSWTTYAAFHALTTDARLGLGAARVLAAENVNRPLLTVCGNGQLEILWQHEVVASVPILEGIPDPSSATAWASSTLGGRDVKAETAGVGLWDVETAHISIINLDTVRALGKAAGQRIDPDRFRANIYLDGLEPWAEFDLVGKRVRIGAAELEVFSPIERCRATAARPGAAEWDINVPGLLATYFGHAYCGVYARVVVPGQVQLDDRLVEVSGKHSRIPGPDVECIAESSPRRATVIAAMRPTANVRSIIIRDPFGMLHVAEPGQYLRVHGGAYLEGWRNYTISGVEGDLVRLTVECKEPGRFTPFLQGVEAGDSLLVSGPYGDATPADVEYGVSIITAGIGITPALRIVQHLARTRSRRPVQVTHVARGLEQIPHLDELVAAAASLYDFSGSIFITGHAAVPRAVGIDGSDWEVHAGRPTLDQLASRITAPRQQADQIELFACGSTAFVELVLDAARGRGVAEQDVHRDPFYSPPDMPPEPIEPPAPGPFTVRWGSGQQTSWTPQVGSLLDLAESAGLRPSAGCRAGVCGSCAYDVAGDTAPLFNSSFAPTGGRVLLCAAVPAGDVAVAFEPSLSAHRSGRSVQ